MIRTSWFLAGGLALLWFYLVAQVILLLGLRNTMDFRLSRKQFKPGSLVPPFSLADLRLGRRIVTTFAETPLTILLFLDSGSQASRCFVQALNDSRGNISSNIILCCCQGVERECQDVLAALPNRWAGGFDATSHVSRAYGIVRCPTAIILNRNVCASEYMYLRNPKQLQWVIENAVSDAGAPHPAR